MTMIDDFSSGPTALDLPYGPASVAHIQAGTMLGGGRYTFLHIAGDPRHEPAHLDTGSGSLDISCGAEQHTRIEVGYGTKPDDDGNPAPAP